MFLDGVNMNVYICRVTVAVSCASFYIICQHIFIQMAHIS